MIYLILSVISMIAWGVAVENVNKIAPHIICFWMRLTPKEGLERRTRRALADSRCIKGPQTRLLNALSCGFIPVSLAAQGAFNRIRGLVSVENALAVRLITAIILSGAIIFTTAFSMVGVILRSVGVGEPVSWLDWLPILFCVIASILAWTTVSSIYKLPRDKDRGPKS